MDLNEIKNRAKDLLADLTEPRRDEPADRAPTTPEVPEQRATEQHPGTVPPTQVDDLDRPAEPGRQHVPEQERPLPEPEATAATPAATSPAAMTPAATTPAAEPAADRAMESAPRTESAPATQPRAAEPVPPVPAGPPADPARLVTAERTEFYGARWAALKGGFVDEPRQAVAQADALVGELLDELGRLFEQQRRGIEQGLDNDDVSTEELRVALRRYRSFFDRLLSV
jgi:hypothetical protein